MARSFEVNDEDELALLESYNLLTYKPVIFAANVMEDELADDGASNEGVCAVREFAEKENCEVFAAIIVNSNVFIVDDDLLTRAGPRMGQSVKELYSIAQAVLK